MSTCCMSVCTCDMCGVHVCIKRYECACVCQSVWVWYGIVDECVCVCALDCVNVACEYVHVSLQEWCVCVCACVCSVYLCMNMSAACV